MVEDLNTSHVKLQRKEKISQKLSIADLNTSHVKLQQEGYIEEAERLIFKYISC